MCQGALQCSINCNQFLQLSQMDTRFWSKILSASSATIDRTFLRYLHRLESIQVQVPSIVCDLLFLSLRHLRLIISWCSRSTLRSFLFLLIFSTPTIIEVPQIRAIEEWLTLTLIDLIMHSTTPCRRGAPTLRLRWKLLYNLLKVLCALAAWIQPSKQVDVGLQRLAFFRGRIIRKSRKGCVEELPGGAAELSFRGFVAEFGHDGCTGLDLWGEIWNRGGSGV